MPDALVSSTSELQAALRSAQGGDTIRLAPGTYTGLNFSGINLKFSDLVTITSADPSARAVINDFTILRAANIRFADLNFETLNRPDKVALGPWAYTVQFSDSIHFDNIKVHGSLDGDASNDVRGLSIRDSTNIGVRNSEFQQLDRSLAFAQTSNILVSGNLIHDIRSDGFNFAEVKNVGITNNVFHSFNPSKGDHPDAIQFFTSGTKTSSTDITISGNVIFKGDGEYTQAIFMRDELETLPFQRVNISDNLIVGTGWNGIRIMGVQDLTLARNELVTFKGDNVTWLLVQKANGVVATDNRAGSISFDGSTGVSQSGSTITKPVDDEGAMALRKWIEANPDTAPRLSGLDVLLDHPATASDTHFDSSVVLTSLPFNFGDGGFLF